MLTQHPLDHGAFVWALSAFRQLNRIDATLDQPHASFEQIIQACQLAEIHQTIENSHKVTKPQ